MIPRPFLCTFSNTILKHTTYTYYYVQMFRSSWFFWSSDLSFSVFRKKTVIPQNTGLGLEADQAAVSCEICCAYRCACNVFTTEKVAGTPQRQKKSPFAHHRIKQNLHLHTLTQVAILSIDRAKITKAPDPFDPWEHLGHDQADQPSPPGSGQAPRCQPWPSGDHFLIS